MNQIFILSGGQPAVKFNLPDVISTRVGQSGNCLFLTLHVWSPLTLIQGDISGDLKGQSYDT